MAFVTVVVCFIVSCVMIDVTLANDDNAFESLTLRIKRLEHRDEIQQEQITRSKRVDEVMQNEIDRLRKGEVQLHNRIKSLEKLEEEHQNQIKRLEESDAFLQNKINRLDENSKHMKDKISKVEERVELCENKVKHLQDNDERMYDTIKRLNERDEFQKKSITRLFEDENVRQGRTLELQTPFLPQGILTSSRHQNVAIKRNTGKTFNDDRSAKSSNGVPQTFITKPVDRKERADANNMEIAFFATLSSTQMHVGVHQPIVFDNVITNIGNGYHSHVGTFIAPVSGTYVFSVTLLSAWNQDVAYAIMKNGTPISNIYNNGLTAGNDSGSQTFILQLNQNDDVVIHNIVSDKNTHGDNYSTFAGFLLRQHFQAEIVG